MPWAENKANWLKKFNTWALAKRYALVHQAELWLLTHASKIISNKDRGYKVKIQRWLPMNAYNIFQLGTIIPN